MKLISQLAIGLVLAAAGALRASAAWDGSETTWGLWLFDGESEASVSGTLPNWIPDSPLALEAVTVHSSSTAAALSDATYTNDVPAAWLFADGTWATRYPLRRSLRLHASSARTTANALRAALEPLADESFTVEWFVKGDPNVGAWVDGMIAGISHVTAARNPLWRWDAYVNGAGNVRTNGTGGTQWIDARGNGKNLGNSGAWHHAAVTYDRARQRIVLYIDYMAANTVVGPGTGTADLAVGADAVFQIFGTMGQATRSYFAQNVAAVRISKGVLGRRQFMVVNDRREPKTITHYRFDGKSGAVVGTSGAPAVIPNVALPLPCYDAYVSKYNKGYTASYTSGVWRRRLVDETGKPDDRSSILSYTNGVPYLFQLNAFCPPEYLCGSFTAEMILRPDVTAMNVLPLFGQGAVSISETGWCAYLFHGSLKIRHYLAGRSPTAIDYGPVSHAIPAGSWAHVAVTYDAAARQLQAHVHDESGRYASSLFTLAEGEDELWRTEYATFNLSSQGSFNSGAEGGLCGAVDEFRFSRGVLKPEEFLEPKSLPGFALVLGPRAVRGPVPPPRDEPVEKPVTTLLLPESVAPFVYAERAVQTPVLEVTSFAHDANETQGYAAGLTEQPALVCGDKSVVLGRNSDGSNDPASYEIATVCRNGTPVLYFHFWGSNKNGYGWPFAEIEGDPESWTRDDATGTVVYSKPYLDCYDTRRVFTYTLRPEGAGRIRLDWDCGCPDDGRSYNTACPWVVFAPNTFDKSTLDVVRDGVATRREPAFDDDLDEIGTNTVYTAADGIVWAADDPTNRIAVTYDARMVGNLTETRVRAGNYRAEQHSLLWQCVRQTATNPPAGSITIDLGESAVLPTDTPPAVGNIDFWRTDATEVSARPTRNLLANASFESGLRYFRYIPGGAWYHTVPADRRRNVITNDAHTGKSALYSQPDQGYASGIRTFPVPTEAGKKYTLSFWGKAKTSGTGISVSLASAAQTGGKFKWYPEQSAPESSYTMSTAWTRYTRTFEADAGGVMVQIGAMHHVWLDDFQLEEGEAATDFVCDPVEGRLVTCDPDNSVARGADPRARYALTSLTNAGVIVNLRLQNAFRETLWEDTRTVAVTEDATTEIALPFTPDFPGEGIYVLRAEYRLNGYPAWSDFHRLMVMEPLGNTHATKDLFGTLLSISTIQRAEDLAAKLRAWGFGSTTWGTTRDMSDEFERLPLMKKYGFANYFRPIYSEDPVLSQYLAWTNVTDEIVARIEQVAYDTVRTNDAMFTVWAFGNEEEGSTLLRDAKPEAFAEYAKAQLACYRGVKRANPNAWVMPTCGTSGYSLDRGYKAIHGYLKAAKDQGVLYDAVAVHQYWSIDKGTLSDYDMDTETQRLSDTLAAYGYPADTPLVTTEMFNVPETSIPQWGAYAFYDGYQSGKPGYDWSLREYVQAASVARIYLTGLKWWPRMPAINIWVSEPFTDYDLSPLMLCKAVNTLGHHFPDVTHLRKVAVGETILGHVYRRNTDSAQIAAIWTHDRDVERGLRTAPRLEVKLPSDARIFDMTGRRRAFARAADGTVVLTVAPAPLLIEAANLDAFLP